MHRALLVSLGLHALGLALVGAAVRPRFTVPPRLQQIPIDFIALAAPSPAITERADSEPEGSLELAELAREKPVPPPRQLHPRRSAEPSRRRPEPARPLPRRDEPRGEEARRPEPKRVEPYRAELNRAETKPAELGRAGPLREEPRREPTPTSQAQLPRQGRADTTVVMRSELPRVGDLRGAMQMRVDGEVLPYTYYLSIVQRKISSFWELPAGIEDRPGEVAAMVRFRIERDGAVRSSYCETPSGVNPFDACALRAVARALPLPRLPEDYPGDHLIIHLRFVYSHEAGAPAEVP